MVFLDVFCMVNSWTEELLVLVPVFICVVVNKRVISVSSRCFFFMCISICLCSLLSLSVSHISSVFLSLPPAFFLLMYIQCISTPTPCSPFFTHKYLSFRHTISLPLPISFCVLLYHISFLRFISSFWLFHLTSLPLMTSFAFLFFLIFLFIFRHVLGSWFKPLQNSDRLETNTWLLVITNLENVVLRT